MGVDGDPCFGNSLHECWCFATSSAEPGKLSDQYLPDGFSSTKLEQLIEFRPLVRLVRSMYYYKQHRRDETLLSMRMKEIATTRVRYGFWRIFVLLRREGLRDNHKRMYRVYKAYGLNLRTKRPRHNRSAEHRLKRLDTQGINKVWSLDFVQDVLFNGERFRVLTVVKFATDYCWASR